MADVVHHLGIGSDALEGNGDLGRYVLLPGSAGRASQIAARFSDSRCLNNPRGLDVHLGQLRRDGRSIDVAAVASGMGCPSVDIVVTELVQLGARRLLRVGTAGAMQATLRPGDLVVATAAVRDEATSDVYVPREFPAEADALWVQMLCGAARRLGHAQRTYRGVVHSKDAFFGRERHGARYARSVENQQYMEVLRRSGVLATEMEVAHLFVLGAVLGDAAHSLSSAPGETALRCGAIVAVVGDMSAFASAEQRAEAEARLVDVALAGLWDLAVFES